MSNALGYPSYTLTNTDNGSSLSFNTGAPDVNGCFWYLDGDLGGWDAPDVRQTMLPRVGLGPSADGETAADLHYRGRTITFALVAECPSETARQLAWSLLAEVLDNLSGHGQFQAFEDVPKALNVTRAGNAGQGRLTVADTGHQQLMARTRGMGGLPIGSTVWTLRAGVEVYAQDPRKYAMTQQIVSLVGGVAAVNNQGNTPSQAVTLIMTGLNATNPFTVQVGATPAMRLAIPALPGLANIPPDVFLDFYNKLVLDGGGNNYYYLRDLTTPWPAVPIGPQSVVVSEPCGGTVGFYPAWI